MLKPYFKAAQIDPLVMQNAVNSKATIKRANIRQNTARYDPELLSRAPGTWNIFTDSYRR
jgi:hypothetical protein